MWGLQLELGRSQLVISLISGVSGHCYCYSTFSRYDAGHSSESLFAFIYNVAGIPVAAGILFPFWLAPQPDYCWNSDGISSVSVVTNAAQELQPKTLFNRLLY